MDILDTPIARAGGSPPPAPGAPAPEVAPARKAAVADILDQEVVKPQPVNAPKLEVPTGGAVLPIPKSPLSMDGSTPAIGGKPLTFGDVVTGLKQVPGLAWDAVSAIPKALINSELKPSADELAVENKVTSKPTSTYGKVVQAIPNAATKAAFRFFQPMFQPVAEDISSIMLEPEFAKKVADGEMPLSALEAATPALQKSNLQVFGDVVMAGLAVYMPDLLGGAIGKAASSGAVDALKTGAVNGAVSGVLFGTASVLASGTTDPKEIAKIYAENLVGGTLLGGLAHSGIPISREVYAKATKDITEQYGLPRYVYIDAAKIKDVFQTGTLASAQENDLIRSLGLNGAQYRQAFKDGLSIEIPAQNITTITDKPYWAQIKDAFGFKATNKTITTEPTPQFSERIMNPSRLLPSHEDIQAALQAGKTTTQVVYELSQDMPTKEAEKAVEEAQAAPQAEIKPAPAAEVPTKLPDTVDEKVLEKTPGEYQQDFASTQIAHEENVKALEAKVTELEAKVADAAPKSYDKKAAKIALAEVKQELANAQGSQTESIGVHAGAVSSFLQNHLQTEHGVSKEESPLLAGKVMEHITNPELAAKHENTTLREIAKNVVGAHRTPQGTIEVGEPKRKTGTPALDITHTVYGKGDFPSNHEYTARVVKHGEKFALETKNGSLISNKRRNGVMEFDSPEAAVKWGVEYGYDLGKKTQKETVKEAVGKKGAASIKEVAKETKILEPNVRRILGMGAKEGEFERVGDGVYRVKTPDGKEAAVIIPGDSLKELPKLVEKGFKADMVFLDIPYKTKALTGGNRGIKNFEFITPAEFNHVLLNVNKIVKGDESSVFYMFSQAKSGQKQMDEYTALFDHYGFKPVARGEWTKLSKNGKLSTNPRGLVAAPEGIILFNKTGVMPEGKAAPSLAFKLVRPRGYQTEKPAELLKALIEMSTKEGETVLDPFAGSGVTVEQAVKGKRKAVAIEKKPEQAKKIAERAQAAVGALTKEEGNTVVRSGLANMPNKSTALLKDLKPEQYPRAIQETQQDITEAKGRGDTEHVKKTEAKLALLERAQKLATENETAQPIRFAGNYKVTTPKATTLYKGTRNLKGELDGKSYTSNTFILEFGKQPEGVTFDDIGDSHKQAVEKMVSEVEGGVELSAPKKFSVGDNGVTFSLDTPKGGHVAMQAIYYNYFTGSYKDVSFKAAEHNGVENRVMGAFSDGKLVGIIAPVFMDDKGFAAMEPLSKKATADMSSIPEDVKPAKETPQQDNSLVFEKIPREPKPKKEGEPEAEVSLAKALDARELYNAEAAIEQNKPRGYAGTVFKEIATLFNPKGQAQSSAIDVIMRNKGEYERTLFRTERATREIKKMWDAHSQEVALDFMDKVETGRIDEIPAEFRAIAEMYRTRLDNAYDAIKEFKDVPFLENYFPHLWKDPKAVAEANVWAKANARRPLQGNKSFLKHRVFATIQDGIKAGYELETHNPEELMQLHEQNIQKFVMANRIMDDLKARGFVKLVRAGSGAKFPDNFARLNDNIAKVYLNPHIPVLEAYDEQVYEKLSDIISSLGLEHDRKYDIGARGALGFTKRGTDKITTKFGTPLSVIAHELGHQLDYKYDLQKVFKADPDRTYGSESDYSAKELRKLADLRYEGHEVTDSYKQYVRSAPEKMAVMLEAFVHAPEKFKEVAPRTFEKFTEFLGKHEELRPILDIKPSLVMGMREDSVYAGGLVLGGEYFVQKDVARMLNNFLSQDHLMDTALGKGVMNVKNTMNAFQLGFSAFHLTMETLDTMITKFGIGLTKVLHGNMTGFKDMLASPASPYNYFRDGQKFYNGDPQLLEIEKDLFTGGASLRQKQYYKNTVFDSFMKSNREILGMIKTPVYKEQPAIPGDVIKPEASYKKAPAIIKAIAMNVLRLPLAAVEATMRLLFTYYIPRLKVGAFRDLFAAELERNSQRIQDGEMTRENIARDVWNNIENRMGELNYDNLFWNRNLKTGLMLTTRAVGWNLGTAREIGGALFQDVPREAFNAARGKGFDFTPKMAYTLSLFFFVATLGSIYQYLHTGKKPSSVKDLFYPQNGATTASGEPYRVEFPTYLKDIYQSGVPQLLTGNPFGAFDSFAHMLQNKSAPEFSSLLDIATNKDFYGNEIRNPHDNASTQAKQLTLYLVSQLTPFTYQQQQNLAAGKSTAEQQAEAFFGIIKAPSAVIQSDYNAQLQALYQDQVGGFAPQTPEQVAAAAAKKGVVEQVKKGDYSGIQKLIQQGIIKPTGVRSFIQNALLTTPQKEYRGLSPANKLKLQQTK